MAKFYGKIGFVRDSVELPDRPGIWVEDIVERDYYGDVKTNGRRYQNGQSINDDLTISTTISVMSDDYAYENLFAIKYVKWIGGCWVVNNVAIQLPRLELTLGGVYSGKTL